MADGCSWLEHLFSCTLLPSDSAPPVLLALPGPAFPAYRWDEDALPAQKFYISNRRLILKPFSLPSSTHTVQTATSVWDCSLVLAKLLEHIAASPSHSLHARMTSNANYLEVGSGTGMLSIAAALAFPHAHIVATDVAEVIPAIQVPALALCFEQLS